LLRSQALSDTALADIASRLGRQHLLTISCRQALDEVLTDILLKRGDLNVCRALAKNAGLHLALWFAGSAEIYVALKFLGEAVTWSEATVIESLALALRSATFVMPASLGVQEGAVIAICAVFGISAPVALAVSLSKRLAEIVVGVVGLMIWQVFERTILAQRAARAPEEGISVDAAAAEAKRSLSSPAAEISETPLVAK